MAFIEVTGLSKSFGDHVVLRDVSFEIQRGQTVAVIGASGGGKSTMLRCLIGLETADAGTLSIDGQAFCTDGVYLPEKQRVQALGKMGMVFQSFNLFPHLSVLDNLICAPLYVRGENRKSAVERAMAQLDNVGLSDKRDAYPSQLSGGQKQRVAIARALMMQPEVLLFDEPTSALDPELTAEVMQVIRKLAEQKMTMVVVTHEMSFAQRVANTVFFMDDAQILHRGSPDAIFGGNLSPRLARFLAEVQQ